MRNTPSLRGEEEACSGEAEPAGEAAREELAARLRRALFLYGAAQENAPDLERVLAARREMVQAHLELARIAIAESGRSAAPEHEPHM